MDTAKEKIKLNLRAGFRAVWNLLRPYKREMVLISIFGFISALANGTIPYVTGRFFDTLVGLSQGEPQGRIPLWMVLLIVWAVIQVIANGVDWILDRRQLRAEMSLHFGIEVRGLTRLLRLPMAFHKEQRINEMTDRISKAGWQVTGIFRTLVNFGPQFLSVLVGIALAATIHSRIALILVGGVVIYLIVLWSIVRTAAESSEVAHKAWNEGWGDGVAVVNQIESVKQATAEEYETTHLKTRLLEQANSLWYKMGILWSNIGFIQRLIVFTTQLTVFILSIHYIALGTLSIGELIALNGYAAMFFGPFVTLGYNWQTVQNGLTSAVRADEIFTAAPENYNDSEKEEVLVGAVEFRDVSFQYGPKQRGTLHDVSFTIHPGETVAFVGESGVGKSTAVSLISAYYFPTQGSVLVDGVDTKRHNLTNLRRQIAVVPQEVALFNTTIASNIKYGSFGATDEDVRHAAQEAHIAEFIEGLPKKYETIVGERGMKLSVGQKQRISIARAVLRNPAILILDEPTSALDARTEQLISVSLEKLMEGRTTFIIAHRLSTVRKADRILVFDKGMVVEEGKHNDLIKIKDGVYRRLYDYQIGLRG
jgi:ATP-binding cassette subfamily B protein